MWNVMKQVLWVGEFGNTFVENRNLSQERAKIQENIVWTVLFRQNAFLKKV